MSLPRNMGCFYLVDENRGPVRYKREIAKVSSVEALSWLPGKAYVHYFDEGLFYDTAGPLKIYHRKNGSAYVQFHGHRYNIDESKPDVKQYL